MTKLKMRFNDLREVAKAHGFVFERTNRGYELFSNERALGVTAEYDTLDEALPDMTIIAEGGNPLAIEQES